MNNGLAMKIGRRTLIVSLLGLLATITFVGRKKAEDHRAFRFDQIFVKLIDTFIPSDKDPGALDVGIDQQLLSKVRANKGYFQKIFSTLQVIHDISIRDYGRAFDSLDLRDRVNLIGPLLLADFPDQNTRVQLISLRAKTITYFYTSGAAFKMLNYHPPSQGGYPDYDAQPG